MSKTCSALSLLWQHRQQIPSQSKSFFIDPTILKDKMESNKSKLYVFKEFPELQPLPFYNICCFFLLFFHFLTKLFAYV